MPAPMLDDWKVLVTPYFEYVVYESICISVRERESGEWLDRHYAIGREVALERSDERPGRVPDLVVRASFSEVQVGPVLSIQNPSRDVLERITRRARAPIASWATQS